mmetsp:Transcript_39982/g.62390  ORF Transcript_39982/g.62390 Transcript_39982/m.62390 type:complete len:129 (-) Transcript_39982:642-1028(-)|eukprot:CAMPEP_0184298574 /NCGR_PEP_ID=MMETSP1049-20130417/9365_1 /TAXON_ID=77928 /ORGANISM="Proteomonas sulcata, Strain CCMP704" /LENGTH=128 /DNA_ID=CAMNT_0026608745 /DNA_START=276 /DNA_END=662 /DNA_ORIENTATION=-
MNFATHAPAIATMMTANSTLVIESVIAFLANLVTILFASYSSLSMFDTWLRAHGSWCTAQKSGGWGWGLSCDLLISLESVVPPWCYRLKETSAFEIEGLWGYAMGLGDLQALIVAANGMWDCWTETSA